MNSGSFEVAQYLLEECKVDPNQTSDGGWNVIMAAMENDNVKLVKYLLEKTEINVN